MFPLAKTGTETAALTALILSQSASPCDGKLKAGLQIVRRTHGVVSSLFPCATMASEYLCPGPLEHPGVFDRLLDTREDPELRRDGDG